MRDEKHDAVKRIRPLKKGDPLPAILGLAAGIVLLIVVLILVWVFVLRENGEKDGGSVQSESQSESVTAEEESETESETDSGETESESEPISESETEEIESESEEESAYADDAAEILEGMTLEQKVDQLFFITPLALIKANGAGDNYTYVEAVGTTTTAAYQAFPLGGVIVGESNRTSDNQDIAAFINDLRALSEDVQLLIAMTQTDYDTFTNGGSVFTAEIILEDSGETAYAHASDEALELVVQIAEIDVTAQEVAELLSDGADMILVNDTDDAYFDYASLRADLLSLIEAGTSLTEEDLDEKVAYVLAEKLRMYGDEIAEEDETESETDGTSASGSSYSSGAGTSTTGNSSGTAQDADSSSVTDSTGTGTTSSTTDSTGTGATTSSATDSTNTSAASSATDSTGTGTTSGSMDSSADRYTGSGATSGTNSVAGTGADSTSTD
ncbi:MAG: hypothetical protein LUF35_08720 [Lachnospiraceae bacterium]|nr:hypothetical protein [Lachnospiraceae bacterium]